LKILASALFFLSSGLLPGQTAATITDVDYNLVNNSIVINYSIAGAYNNEVYEIGLRFVTETGQTIIPVSVRGDIGPNITGGFNKTIFWDIDNDRLEISGVLKALVTIVSSHVIISEPYIGTPLIRGEKPLGGPGYAFLSFVVPSLGGYFVEKNKTRTIITSITEATLAIHLLNLNGKIKQYETDLDNTSITPIERNEINDNLATAEDNYSKSMATFALIWVVDIVWVAIKGTQNVTQGKTKKGQNFNGNGLNLNYNGNQLCVGYKITF
jgi:hypothetical protein